MSQPRWKKLFDSSVVRRSSQTLTVVAERGYIYGGEVRPREPVDSDVCVFGLDSADQSGVSKVLPSTSTSTPIPRLGSASTAIHGKVYFFSGRGGVAMGPIEEKGALWVLDTANGDWSLLQPQDSKSPYPAGRSYHAMTNNGDDTIFLHAGCPEKGRLSNFWAFDIHARSWKELKAAPEPARGGPSIAFSEGSVYRMNGFDGKTEQGGSLDIYRPGKDTWTTFSFAADGVSGPGARSVGCLLALQVAGKAKLATLFGESDPSNLGHQGAGKMLGDIWVFDIEAGSWEKVQPSGEDTPPARGWFGADVFKSTSGHSIVVHGGLDESNERLGDVWQLQL